MGGRGQEVEGREDEEGEEEEEDIKVVRNCQCHLRFKTMNGADLYSSCRKKEDRERRKREGGN